MRHILAHATVSAGGAADKGATFVDQGDAQAVDLWLANVFERRIRDDPLYAVFKFPHVRLGGGVIQRKHGATVSDRGKALGDLASDFLGGGFGSDKLLMLLFLPTEFIKELVIFGVGDLRPGEYIIKVVVPTDQPPQLLHPRIGFFHVFQGFAHGVFSSFPHSSIPPSPTPRNPRKP